MIRFATLISLHDPEYKTLFPVEIDTYEPYVIRYSNKGVLLTMVDTIGSGIRKMYNYQRRRLFPLPNNNLADNRVEVTITGKILDMNSANILAGNPDLNLLDIELLNRIQLGKSLCYDEIVRLKNKHLIKKRKPKFFIAKQIAQKVKNPLACGYLEIIKAMPLKKSKSSLILIFST